ncbi:unnamed protein product, partial [marine sediment metagenome]
MPVFGYVSGLGEYDSAAQLQKINNNPKKFQIGMVFSLIAHLSVITLPILLFVVFSPYNIILGIVWMIFRIGEGSILIYNDKNYWGLINKAKRYSVTNGAEQNSISDLALTILKTRDKRWDFTQFLWGLGTLTFSIMLVTYGAVTPFIGWLGIGAGIFGVFYNGIKFVKINLKKTILKVFIIIGSLFGILFEVLIGGLLLFFP